MKSTAALLMIVLLVATTGVALECRVVTTEEVAISGARVTVIARGDSLVADKDGFFVLDPVPEIPFVLFVARPDGVALRPGDHRGDSDRRTANDFGGAPR